MGRASVGDRDDAVEAVLAAHDGLTHHKRGMPRRPMCRPPDATR
jgi:hypothetical protein